MFILRLVKQTAEREIEDARKRMDAIEPIVELLTTVAGRKDVNSKRLKSVFWKR